MNSSLDIEALIGRVARRDRRAFRQLFDATSARLFGLVCVILADRAAARAALHDAYVKIWRGADRFADSGQSALTWLSGITRNVAVDRLQRMSHVGEGADDIIAHIYWQGCGYDALAQARDISVEDAQAQVSLALTRLKVQAAP